MKLTPANPFLRSQRLARLAAFTLTEIMVAMAVFSLVVVALVYSHLLGLRMFNVTATKLSASANARAALNHVRDDIRSAKTLYIGSGDYSSFTHVPDGNLKVGNALQIYPTTDSNSFIRYYLNPSSHKLMRIATPGTNPVVVASFVTNAIAFSAEDFLGNTLTNDQNNRVIKMSLEFYQWEFPVASSRGPGALYDYYRLQTRMTRRAIE